MAVTGRMPSTARPPAKVTACCSQMPTSKKRVGNSWRKSPRPVPSGMAAVMATILGFSPGQAHQGVAEDLGVGRDLADALLGLAGIGIELAQAVKAGGVGLRRLVALALGGEHVHQDGPFQVLDILEGLDQVIQTVPVHRPQVGELEGLEEHARREKGLEGLFAPLGPGQQILADGRQGAQQVLHLLFQENHGGPGEFAAEKGRHGPHVGGDGHAVVVEDDDEVLVEVAGVVQALEGDARGHGAVADHRDHLVPLPLQAAGAGHPQGRGNGGGAVPGVEGVVAALAPLGKAAEAAVLPQGVEPVAAAR